MPTVYRKTNTDSGLGGGTDFNKAILLPASDTTGTTSVSVNPSATVDSFGYTDVGVPGTLGITGDYVVGMGIVSAQNDIQMSCAVARVNSSGTQQAISSFATEQQATAGAHDFTFTSINLGTWAAGDRLRITYRYRNTHAHTSRSITVEHGGVDNEVDAPWDTATAHLKLVNETAAVSDDELRARIMARIQAESVQVQFEVPFHFVVGEALLQIIGETVNIGIGTLTWDIVQVENDSVSLSDAQVRLLSLVRLQGESVSLSESVISLRGLARIVAETVALSESNARVVDLLRLIADTVAVDEDDIRLRDLLLLVNDSLSVDEDDLRFRGMLRLVAETISEAEDTIALRGLIRAVLESVSTVEVDLHFTGLVRQIAESVTTDEDALALRGLLRLVAESMETTEITAGLRALIAVVEEALGLDESVEHYVVFVDLPDLIAVAVSPTQINVSWTEVITADAYDLERDSVIIVEKTTALSYEDTGLTPETEYVYRVRSARMG